MISESEFQKSAESALESLNRTMDVVVEQHDVEVLYQAGVLSIEIEEPIVSKIIISPNSPARQVWISAQLTSFKLDWSEEGGAFQLRDTGESLAVLIGRLLGEELGVGPIAL